MTRSRKREIANARAPAKQRPEDARRRVSKKADSESQPVASGETQKLQKVLAQTGIGSRRKMEELIEQGLIKVNGQVATLGMRVSSTDRVEFG
ncbi:MAG: S4 domain-containing protein, partial [Proteobacteria bacterium]|nr:S4 domain-containing protein [Pseudomonadota bacterium]